MIKKLSIIFLFCLVTAQYDYTLEDINSSSYTYGQQISPSFFQDAVTLHYFGYFKWGTCTNRFGQLNNIYEDLKAQGYHVELIGIASGSQSS